MMSHRRVAEFGSVREFRALRRDARAAGEDRFLLRPQRGASRDEVPHSVRARASSQVVRPIMSCIPPGPSSPACSAIVKQIWSGNGASTPATKFRTRHRGQVDAWIKAHRPYLVEAGE